MKKLIPALALLLVSAVMLATSSFAWFSMNTTVTVTGMEVKTRVSDNLFVRTIGLADPAPANDESDFASFLTLPSTATLLEPVSTVDAKAFFYTDSTTNVDAVTGEANNNTFIEYAPGDAFDENYGVNDTPSTADAKGYVDYIMELKAVNGSGLEKNLKLTKLNLTYKGVETAQKAFRVAVFMEEFNGSEYTMVSEETLPTAKIFGYSGSTYFNEGNEGKAVSGEDTLSTAPALNASSVTATVPAGQIKYYKVVARVWLEGQDTTCNNDTFASLTKNWALDIAFELGTATAATGVIGTAAIAATDSGVTLDDETGKLSNGETPAASNAYVWYNALTGAVVDGATTAAAPAATATAGTYYCVVTTVKGNTYVTNNITVPAQNP